MPDTFLSLSPKPLRFKSRPEVRLVDFSFDNEYECRPNPPCALDMLLVVLPAPFSFSPFDDVLVKELASPSITWRMDCSTRLVPIHVTRPLRPLPDVPVLEGPLKMDL